MIQADRLRVRPVETEALVTPLEGFLFLTSMEGSATLLELLIFGTMQSVCLPDVATAPKQIKNFLEHHKFKTDKDQR